MSEGSGGGGRWRWFRPSRRALIAASLAALVLSFLGFLWLLRPRRSPAGTGQEESAPATVTVEAADLKREPSARSATLAKLPRGTRLAVLRDRGLWIEVQAKDASGYLPAEALERDSDREARKRRAGTILSFPPVAGLVVEDADLLLAPFPMAPRAGRLQKGATIQIHSVDHAYYALRGPDGGLAFVDSAKVDVIPPDPRRPPIVPARERAPKDLEVTELTAPLPLTPGEGAASGGVPGAPPAPGPAPLPPGPPGEQPLEPATIVSKVGPAYPEAARRAGVEGTVVLDVTIGADGRVAAVEVVRGLPLGLSEAAANAVRRWQYRPARGRSGPIASRKEVRIEFRLRS
ncbi:MAG: TonB family protein [Acidobacteriota bacterium]